MDIADVMVESAIGCIPVPLGIADGFLVDGRDVAIPLAVEEPSVIAAASYAARLVRRSGGFTTWAAAPLMTAQVFLENVPERGENRIASRRGRYDPPWRMSLHPWSAGRWVSRHERGATPSGTVRVDLTVDVRDTLGANRLNTAAETVRPLLESVSGGRALMAVLTNAARDRVAGARYSLPVEASGRGCPRHERAGGVPQDCRGVGDCAGGPVPRRHSQQGIMNGISSMALATLNDTRSVEAAAHAWACRDGRCRGLPRTGWKTGSCTVSSLFLFPGHGWWIGGLPPGVPHVPADPGQP